MLLVFSKVVRRFNELKALVASTRGLGGREVVGIHLLLLFVVTWNS